MPLARVRTSFPNIPEELKQQLQLAGYDIEIVSPGKKVPKPADLELTLETLPVREALKSASRSSTVYIAPGALAKPAVVPLPGPKAVTPRPDRQGNSEQQILTQRRAEQQAVEAERLRREQDRLREENERKRVEQAGQQSVPDLNSRLQAERERVEAESRRQQQVLDMWRDAEARHALPHPGAVLPDEKRREQEREAEARHQAQLAEAQRFNELREQQERELRAKEEEHRRWVAEQARIQQEQEQIRLELQRKEEAIRSEQQRLRAERERFQRDRLMSEQAAERARQVAPPSVPANVVPIVAATSLNTAIVEPTVIRTASGETANVGVTPVAKGAQLVERRRRPRLIEGGARRLRHKEYRRAAVAAAALTAVVMGLWIILSAREPASPLATNKLVQSVGMEQSAPFGAAKLNAPVEVSRAASPQPAPAKQLAPTPQTPAAQTAQTKKSGAVKPSPKKKSRKVRAPADDDGQEVVVRHFNNRTTASTTKKTASTNKDGVKVFSDMD